MTSNHFLEFLLQPRLTVSRCRRFSRFAGGFLGLALSLGPGIAAAKVTLPAIFGDHMVLQENATLPVWGTASPGEAVTVSVGGRQGRAVADAHGMWRVQIEPLPAGGRPVELRITGTNEVVFHDVLIGDVWLCSGQSNMEFGIKMLPQAAETIAQADDPQLRYFIVGTDSALQPKADCRGHWLVCTPDNLQKGGSKGLTAVGYFFGRDLRRDRRLPIGLIEAAVGGTPAQAWTSLEALQANPLLVHYADAVVKLRDNLPQLKQDYDTHLFPAWQKAHDLWQRQYGVSYEPLLQQWKTEAAAAAQANRPPPPLPRPGRPEPVKPVFVGTDIHNPTIFFNAMIHPLIPYALKGTIWYQGETNADQAQSAPASQASDREYATLFPALISDWRSRWGAVTPFLYVQLASFDAGPAHDWALLREAQFRTLSVPQTGMTVAIDVGDQKHIHPTDKLDVGRRLALIARRMVYGENIVSSGPVYDHMEIEGDKIRIHFKPDGAGTGLIIGPTFAVEAPGTPPPPANELHGFTIAGADHRFVPARAVIDGDTVVVSSDKVPQPGAVRYGWTDFPIPPVNLENREGLPAVPFATDGGGW